MTRSARSTRALLRSALGVVPALVLALTMLAIAEGQPQRTTPPTSGSSATGEAPDFRPTLEYAQVTFVEVEIRQGSRARVSVTVRHDDEGWDHYADAWQIVDPSTGEVLAERVLLHPHVSEQPFTRALSDVALPPHLDRIRVRARCNVHGFGGREIVVELGASEGPGFVVRR